MSNYLDLLDVLGEVPMEGYCSPDYWVWEREVATPKLIELGYAVSAWVDGERDSFGPLSRVVTVSKGETIQRLVYG